MSMASRRPTCGRSAGPRAKAPNGGCLWAAILMLCSAPQPAPAAESALLQLQVAGQRLEGTAAAWSDTRVLFLSRSGFLHDFSPQEAADYRLLSPGFRPYSPSEMRGALHREFGAAFEVSGTGSYLVVHPAGEKDRWADRFENLSRSFVHYFTTRGMQPTPPPFPLVAVVFPAREEFVKYVQRTDGAAPSDGIVGLYSLQTNRVLLYDVTQGSGGANWHQNASTIIHEATHQLAFNTGIHSRLAMPPRWAGEGLAMLFEAPGVWDPVRHPDAHDRVNRDRLASFRQFVRGEWPAGSLTRLLQQPDRLFTSTPERAYAEAWALTYFLSETEPVKYLQYLRRTAARAPLQRYSAQHQLREFTDVFGTDLTMLEARLLRFLEGL